MDEVSDASEDDSVVEVSDASGDDESEAGVCDRVAWFGPFGEEYEGDDYCDEGEDDKEPALSCADSEDGSGVEYEDEIEDSGDHDDGFVIGDEVSDVLFCENICSVNVYGDAGDMGEGE